MKIGFDAKRAFYNSSGLGNYSRNLVLSLAKYFPENQYYLYTPSVLNNKKFSTQPDLKVITPDDFTGRIFKSFWRSFAVSKQINRNQIDIYHGLSNEIPKGIDRNKIASIITIHDLIFIRYPDLYKSFDRKVYFKKVKFGCEGADKIIAISNQTKSDLINFLKIAEDRIDVIYQNCNSAFYDKASELQKNQIRSKYNLPSRYLLYVGTIEKRKNLLAVLKGIHQCNIDYPLVVVGKATEYLNEIKQFISINKMTDQVVFHNYIDNNDLPSFYQMADIFIYPSIFEGFGIPIIEALHSGTPVITSQNSCFSESGGPSSIYINPEKPEEIGNSINLILSDNQLRNKMITNGYIYVEKFKDDAVAANIIQLYKKCIKT
ncbi:MAG: glycosyltransferase family 1 protein [Bacteroidota bacterium]